MEEYKIRIRGVEVVVTSVEALDQLIQRYGVDGDNNRGIHSSKVENGVPLDQSRSSMEKAVLKAFIDADKKGIPSRQLAVTLGANRKAVQIGLKKWAETIGIWQGNFDHIFEKVNREGTRGYRLTPEAMEAGKMILGI